MDDNVFGKFKFEGRTTESFLQSAVFGVENIPALLDRAVKREDAWCHGWYYSSTVFNNSFKAAPSCLPQIRQNYRRIWGRCQRWRGLCEFRTWRNVRLRKSEQVKAVTCCSRGESPSQRRYTSYSNSCRGGRTAETSPKLSPVSWSARSV
jgi:hypothetical protein